MAVVMMLGTACAMAQGGVSSLVNRKAPEFTRRDLRGQPLDLAKLRGKVVLLNFWATWCAPCEAEMPEFAKWQQQYGAQGLAVVGISMDDDEASVRKTLKKLHVDYPIAMGDAALGKRYGGVLGLPMSFLIDRNGVVRAEFQGEADLGKVEAALKDLMSAR
jgi:cytochrome c biogenesis protein CcmG, thiol:disulfide interchange protein DsbE